MIWGLKTKLIFTLQVIQELFKTTKIQQLHIYIKLNKTYISYGNS
jgi:hypothetical protein